MERILEPELMTDEEQCLAYAKADFQEPNTRFLNYFQKTFGENIEGHVLDMGCGNADITIRFAKKFLDCQIIGIDGSASMLNHGQQALDNESLDTQKRVSLVNGIVPEVQLPRSHYDVIISNSLLHQLHNPSVLWEFIKNYGGEGTKVFIGDLLRPFSPDQATEIIDLYAKEEPEILRHDFYNSLLAAFEISEIKDQLNLAGLHTLSVEQVSDRHVIISGTISA